MTTSDSDLGLVLVADPMCSWCWGFAPVVRRLAEDLDLPVRVVVGGLRPGPAAVELDDHMAQFLQGCWTEVHKASGQPFDHTLLQTRGWHYDTELACTAVVAARRRAPEHSFAMLEHLHHAFYMGGSVLSDPTVYPGIFGSFEGALDPDDLISDLSDAAVRKETWADFSWCMRNGIRGFPALLVAEGPELTLVTRGFAPYDVLASPLSQFLAERRSAALEGSSCAIDVGS